jgi:hypothetical protein
VNSLESLTAAELIASDMAAFCSASPDLCSFSFWSFAGASSVMLRRLQNVRQDTVKKSPVASSTLDAASSSRFLTPLSCSCPVRLRLNSQYNPPETATSSRPGGFRPMWHEPKFSVAVLLLWRPRRRRGRASVAFGTKDRSGDDSSWPDRSLGDFFSLARIGSSVSTCASAIR